MSKKQKEEPGQASPADGIHLTPGRPLELPEGDQYEPDPELSGTKNEQLWSKPGEPGSGEGVEVPGR